MFGSRATGLNLEQSDIDLVVICDEKSVKQLLEIVKNIVIRCGSGLFRVVDILS